ncbi:hypothetical protein VE26_13210 [Devosia chinhatensis]|uniref:Metallo-beta-lactamase domain-containing protein n=1 Tax=Devosia chinhatensis TaxID=429727 RepID=A0A0F5FHK9_9HYPH|nr:hypothetical protein VE26_13210 [Devosia chinhatensis]
MPLVGIAGTSIANAQQAAGDAAMPDTIPTSAGDLVIHPVDHASLVLEWGDKVIYVDPVGGAELYAGLPAPTAILITHGHGDHFDLPTLEAIGADLPFLTNQEVFDQLPEALKANASAVANGEDAVLIDIPVRAIAAHNTTPDRMQYHPEGVGNGYILTFGDTQVYVAGDTEPTEDMLALTDIDVAFLPMNLPYTMTPEQAAEAINTFKPAIVYPYHYGDSDLSVLDAAIEDGVELRLRNWYPNGQG